MCFALQVRKSTLELQTSSMSSLASLNQLVDQMFPPITPAEALERDEYNDIQVCFLFSAQSSAGFVWCRSHFRRAEEGQLWIS